MRTLILPALICGAACFPLVADARATCPVTSTDTVQDGHLTRDVKRTENFLFYRSGLRVNTDGAPNSYHPIGTSEGALNTICNGVAVYPATGKHRGVRVSSLFPENIPKEERCQIILDIFRESRDADYDPVRLGRIDWFAIARDQNPKSPRKGKPCIQTTGKYKGFFVAQTSLAADPSLESCAVARWVDSMSIPYITLPAGSKVFGTAGATLGDLALVHRRVGGQDRWIVAVVADTGNRRELGEGSIALHRALGHMTQDGAKHPGNLRGEVTTFIFTDRKVSFPISSSSLGDPRLREELMAEAGGESLLLSCIEQ